MTVLAATVYNGVLIELWEPNFYLEGELRGNVVRAELTRAGRKVAAVMLAVYFDDPQIIEAYLNRLYADLIEQEHSA